MNCFNYFTDVSGINLLDFYTNEYYKPPPRNGKKNYLGKILNVLGDRLHIEFARAYSQYQYLQHYISGKTMLEIGSGRGFGLLYFEKKGFDVYGIEPDANNVKHTSALLKNGSCKIGFMEDFDKNTRYDVVILSHVLEHINDLDKTLIGLSKLLKNEGILFIEVPNCENSQVLEQSIKDEPHVYHFTEKGLESIFSKYYQILTSDIFKGSVYTLRQRFNYLIYWVLKKNYYRKADGSNGDVLRIIVKRKAE